MKLSNMLWAPLVIIETVRMSGLAFALDPACVVWGSLSLWVALPVMVDVFSGGSSTIP